MADRFFFEFQGKRNEWNFPFAPLSGQCVAPVAENAAFVRRAFLTGNEYVRRWAAGRPELTADGVRHFLAGDQDDDLRSVLLRNAKLLERLLSQDLLQLIDDKPANLDSVLEALSQSDIPLDELKRFGRELFENFRGPLNWKLLWPRKRKVRLGSSPTKLHPLDGLFIRCGTLALPLSAEEALALPDHMLNELGLFDVLCEVSDSEIRRKICQKQQVPPQIREKLAIDPDLSVRLLAGTAFDRHYQSMMVREDLLFFWPAPCETQVFRLSREGKNWTFRTDGQSGDYGLHKVFSLLDESSDEQTASFIRAAALSEDPFMRGAAACATLQKETASRLAHDADPLVRRALLQNIRSMLQIDADDLIFAVGRDPDLVRTALLMLEVAERLGLACDAGEKRLVLQNSVGELPGMRPLDAEMASSMSEFFHHFLGETQARASCEEEMESGYTVEWNGFEMPLSSDALDIISEHLNVSAPSRRRFARLRNRDKRALHHRIETADLTHRDRMARQAAVLNCVSKSDLALLLTNTELFENALILPKVRLDVKAAIKRMALNSDDPRRIALAQKRDYEHEAAGVLRLGECRAPVSLVDCHRLTSSLAALDPSECSAEEVGRVHALRKALLASPDFSDRVRAAQFASLRTEEASALADERATLLNLLLLGNRNVVDKLSFEMLLELAGSDETRLSVLRHSLIAGNRMEKSRELAVVNEKLSGLSAVNFDSEEMVVWYAPKPVATPWDDVLHLEYLGIDFPLKLKDLYIWTVSIHETPMSFPKPILSFLQSLPDESFQEKLSMRLSKNERSRAKTTGKRFGWDSQLTLSFS